MKNVYFLLFVIAIVTTATSNVTAQKNHVEERQTTIDQERTGNTIRFTVEVERDSSLCLLPVKECYVISQKFKKYVYVDISKTPHITDLSARQAFELKNRLASAKYLDDHGESQLTKDFQRIKPKYAYSNFPWLTMIMTDVKDRGYVYNYNLLRMEKITRMQTVSGAAFHIYGFWALLLFVIFLGLFALRKEGEFSDLFSSFIFPILTTAGFVIVMLITNWVYALIYGSVIALSLILLRSIDEFKSSQSQNRFKAVCNFLIIIGSVFSALLWTIHKYDYCYKVIPFMLLAVLSYFLWYVMFSKLMILVFPKFNHK